jgi:hypothetical protein
VFSEFFFFSCWEFCSVLGVEKGSSILYSVVVLCCVVLCCVVLCCVVLCCGEVEKSRSVAAKMKVLCVCIDFEVSKLRMTTKKRQNENNEKIIIENSFFFENIENQSARKRTSEIKYCHILNYVLAR